MIKGLFAPLLARKTFMLVKIGQLFYDDKNASPEASSNYKLTKELINGGASSI